MALFSIKVKRHVKFKLLKTKNEGGFYIWTVLWIINFSFLSFLIHSIYKSARSYIFKCILYYIGYILNTQKITFNSLIILSKLIYDLNKIKNL